jgi:hypothetical protein
MKNHIVNPETDRCVMCGQNRYQRETVNTIKVLTKQKDTGCPYYEKAMGSISSNSSQ